jgi:hypothetical protein
MISRRRCLRNRIRIVTSDFTQLEDTILLHLWR